LIALVVLTTGVAAALANFAVAFREYVLFSGFAARKLDEIPVVGLPTLLPCNMQ
jgi:hypothetical protein